MENLGQSHKLLDLGQRLKHSYPVEVVNACACREVDYELRGLIARYVMSDDTRQLHRFLRGQTMRVKILETADSYKFVVRELQTNTICLT